jgi:hypothetical protein
MGWTIPCSQRTNELANVGWEWPRTHRFFARIPQTDRSFRPVVTIMPVEPVATSQHPLPFRHIAGQRPEFELE